MNTVNVDTKEYLQFIREEMKHEDELTNARLLWLLVSQAFLFSAYIVAYDSGNKFFDDHGRTIIPFVGLMTAGVIYLGILAAINCFNHWKLKLQTIIKDSTNHDFPKINRPAFTIGLGFFAPIVLPIFLSCVWVFFISKSWFWTFLVVGIALPLAIIFVIEPRWSARKQNKVIKR